jgi:hypothetical protein
LVQGLAADGDAKRRVEFLAHANVETSLDAMGTSYRKTGAVRNAIETTKWELVEAVAGIADDRRAAADGILTQLKEALTHDEYAIALQPRLSKLVDDAIRLLTPTKPKPGTGTKPGGEAGGGEGWGTGRKIIEEVDKASVSAADAGSLLSNLQEKLAADGSLKLDVRWTLYQDSEEK